MWELKKVSSKNSADKNTQKALLQIAENPGRIILDCSNSTTDIQNIIEAVKWRMQRQGVPADAMIISANDDVVMVRYKK